MTNVDEGHLLADHIAGDHQDGREEDEDGDAKEGSADLVPVHWMHLTEPHALASAASRARMTHA